MSVFVFANLLLLLLVARSRGFGGALLSHARRGLGSWSRLYSDASSKAPSNSNSKAKLFSKEWAEENGLVQGYGGLWPGNPNAKTYKVTIKSAKTGEEFVANVPEDRYIYFYFEELGIDLPIVNKQRMCRQGCCTICTANVTQGKTKMDAPLGLLKEFREQNFALTCCAYPRSDIVCELQDEDAMYVKQWAEGFEGGGVEWGGFVPDEDG